MEYKPTGHSCTGENLRSYTNILHQLGVAYLSQKNPAKAREYLEEAVKQVEKNSLLSAEIFNTLGRVAEELREYEQARAYYQRALDIKVEYSDRYSQARTYHQLGRVAEEQEDYAEARAYFEQALEIIKMNTTVRLFSGH